MQGFALLRSFWNYSPCGSLSKAKVVLALEAEELSPTERDPIWKEKQRISVTQESLFTPFSFTIPEDTVASKWKICLTGGGVRDEVEFTVKDFQKPEIEVALTLDKHSCLIGESAPQITGLKAEYFFGLPVTDYSARVSVSRNGLELLSEELDRGSPVFPKLPQEEGTYGVVVNITDAQGRTGDFTTSYCIFSPQPVFEAHLGTEYEDAVLAENISENSIVDGALTITAGIALELKVRCFDAFTNQPIVGKPWSFQMEGENEFWERTDSSRLVTNEQGEDKVTIVFRKVEQTEFFFMMIKCEDMLDTNRVLVLPSSSAEANVSFNFDKKSYRSGDHVTLNFKNVEDPMLYGFDLVGRSVHHSLQTTLTKEINTVSFRVPEISHGPLELVISMGHKMFSFSFPFDGKKLVSHNERLSVNVPEFITTNDRCKVDLKFNDEQGASQDGQMVVYMVDRRLKQHKVARDFERFQETLKPDELLVKKMTRWSLENISDWKSIQENSKQFQCALATWTWHMFCFRPSNKIILVRSRELVNLVAEERELFLTLLSSSFATSCMEMVLKVLLQISEYQIFNCPSQARDLYKVAAWARDGAPSSIQSELKQKIATITNNYVRNDPEKVYVRDMLRDLNDAIRASELAKCKDSLRSLADDYYYKHESQFLLNVRSNFIETSMKSVPFKKGDHGVTIEMDQTGAITTYDLFCFAITTEELHIFDKASFKVKNKFFTIIQHPPLLTISDRAEIVTIVQNTSETESIENATLSIFPKRGIRCENESMISQVVPLVKPLQATSLTWPILASEVCMADVEFVLKQPGFVEKCSLDNPLRIIPPGEPETQTFTNVLNKDTSVQQFTPLVTGEEAYISCGVSITPISEGILFSCSLYFLVGLLTFDFYFFFLVGAMIEGVQSMARYPYGCCEQTYSGIIPNIILLKYFKDAELEISEELRETLVKNVNAGIEKFINQFRNANGGFGLWNSSNPSVFHSGLALSCLCLVKELDMEQLHPIDSKHVQECINFLENRASKKGDLVHWTGAQGAYTTAFPDSSLNDLTATTFVFQCFAMAGKSHPKALEWIKRNILRHSTDCSSVAVVLDALTRSVYANDSKYDLFRRNLKLILLNRQLANGSWAGDSSFAITKSEGVESTAYCLMALARGFGSDAIVQQSLEKGLNFILSKRTGAGFSSTRDTLFACWAVSIVAPALKSGNLESEFSVVVGDNVVRTFVLKPGAKDEVETLFEMAHMTVPLTKDSGPVKVMRTSGKCNASVVVEVKRYFFQNELQSVIAANQSHLRGSGSFGVLSSELAKTTGYHLGETGSISASFVPSEDAEAVMMVIPVPGGFQAKVAEASSMFIHREFTDGSIKLFANKLEKGQSYKTRVTFQTTNPGIFTVNPPSIFEMYDPSKTAQASIGPSQVQVMMETK